jgi:hypothetical protein
MRGVGKRKKRKEKAPNSPKFRATMPHASDGVGVQLKRRQRTPLQYCSYPQIINLRASRPILVTFVSRSDLVPLRLPWRTLSLPYQCPSFVTPHLLRVSYIMILRRSAYNPTSSPPFPAIKFDLELTSSPDIQDARDLTLSPN